MGEVLESGELKLEYRAGAFFLRYFRAPADRAADLPHDSDPQPGCVQGDAAAGLRRCPRIGEHRHRPGAPARSGGNRARSRRRTATREGSHQGPAPRADGPRGGRRRIHPPQRARNSTERPKTRIASTASTPSWTPRSIGSRTGRPPPTRSIIAASSTSTTWRPFAWNLPRSLRKVTAWFSSCWSAATSSGAAGRSYRRAVRSDGIPAALAAGLPGGPGQGPSTSGRRRPRLPPPDAPTGPLAPWSEIEPAFVSRRDGNDLHPGRATLPLYVVVEKILGSDEALPEDWLLAGTTGYDFLNSVAGLFVDPSGLAELAKIYGRFIDERLDFREVALQSKRQIFALRCRASCNCSPTG